MGQSGSQEVALEVTYFAVRHENLYYQQGQFRIITEKLEYKRLLFTFFFI